MVRMVLSGNHAQSYAAKLARVQVVAAYPITPQTSIVEKIGEFVASGELSAEYINVESEHSAMQACISAAALGARTYTATSSQGLLLMHELLHWASGARAPVVMGVWGDYQCPACGSFATNTLPSLIRDFIEPGTLRVEAHDVAILDRGTTESSDSAAGAACAAEQGSYWPYHDWLFANQAGENRGAFRREALDAIAARTGLDTEAFSSCLDSGRHQTAARAEAGRAAIRSTPTLRIGDEEIIGVPAYEQLASLIRQQAGIEAP